MDQANDFDVQSYPAERRSLRVAMVTETYPPEVNGVATTLARVVDGLHRRGHDLQLIRPRQKSAPQGAITPRFDEVLMRGLPIPRYPQLRMGLPSKRSLVKLWSTRRPDVVHVATEGPLGWSALQAARHLHLPVTSDFRTNFHAYSQHYGIAWLNKPIMAYLRKFHNLAACTMVPTAQLKKELQLAGFKRLTVVSRGVDAQRFAPERRSGALRESWGLREDQLVVCCVGRLAPEKNLDLLVNAFEAIRAQDADARLLLVGSGPLRAELEARCPGAIFAGQRSGLDLAAHYASSDLFLFPSMTETFGNVTTEALASGLPLLAFRHAGAAEMISDGLNGRLVTNGDAAAFTRTALELARDRQQRLRLAGGARERAMAQDWDRVCSAFEAELLKACGWTDESTVIQSLSGEFA